MLTFTKITQFPGLVEPFGPDPATQFRWYQHLSTPVRFRIDRQLAIALIASGPLYTFPPNFGAHNEDRWHQPLSEPVRTKPRLSAALNPFYFSEPFSLTNNVSSQESRWHFPWSEPIRLTFKKSIFAAQQKAWTGPDRYLPTANVTAIMAATETEDDIALASINVYNPQPVALIGVQTRVSIVEIAVDMSPVAISEGQ